MALDLVLSPPLRTRQLGHQGYGLGSAVFEWGYVTADAAATVETVGYFNAAAALFNVGDKISACMAMGGTPISKLYIVTANTGTVVTIALNTATAG